VVIPNPEGLKMPFQVIFGDIASRSAQIAVGASLFDKGEALAVW